MSTELFSTWVEQELALRGWRPADLAGAAGLPQATISNILNGNREVGAKAATAIAVAFGLSPEFVFRQAGLLPAAKDDYVPTVRTLADMLQQAADEDREAIVEYAIWYLNRRKKG